MITLMDVANHIVKGSFSYSALNHARLAVRRAKNLSEASVGTGKTLQLTAKEVFETLLTRQLSDTRVASLDRAATIVSKLSRSSVGYFQNHLIAHDFDEAFGEGASFEFSNNPINFVIRCFKTDFETDEAKSAALKYYQTWALVLFARNPNSETPDLDLMIQAPYRHAFGDRSTSDIRGIFPLLYKGCPSRESHTVGSRFNGTAACIDLSLFFTPIHNVFKFCSKSSERK